MTDTKPIPKSLHTVRVVAIMAQMMKAENPHATNEGLVGAALIRLGYVDAPDTHGIAAAALKALKA